MAYGDSAASEAIERFLAAYDVAREQARNAPTNEDELPLLSVDVRSSRLIDASYGGAEVQLLAPVLFMRLGLTGIVLRVSAGEADGMFVALNENGSEFGRAVHYGS